MMIKLISKIITGIELDVNKKLKILLFELGQNLSIMKAKQSFKIKKLTYIKLLS